MAGSFSSKSKSDPSFSTKIAGNGKETLPKF
jgi:hypothetical protein